MNIKDLEDRVQKASDENGMMKFNIVHKDGNEGIWGCFVTPDDKKVYEDNQNGKPFEVFLMNHAFIGRPSWGARVKLTAGGDRRPIIPVQNLVNQIEQSVKANDYPTTDVFESEEESEKVD